MSTADQKFVARRVLKIGDRRIAPGQDVPAGLDRSRLLRMVANNEIVPVGSIEAPDPVPNENVNTEEAGAQIDADGSEQSGTASPDEGGQSEEAGAEQVSEPAEFPKHVGAGTYELSDGARISKADGGKEAAEAQQRLLDELDADENADV